MRHETSEASAKAGPGVLHSRAEHLPNAENGAKKQPIHGAPTHLLGNPKVVVTNRGTSTLVSLTERPWGWPDASREFLHAPLHSKSAKAERYAAELRQRIAEAAWKEHARRERQKDLKLQEAIARCGGGQ